MKFKANQNLCTYISNKYKEQGSYCIIDGFYLIDIIFNDAPYFISLQNNQYQLGSNKESNSILGHLFKINGNTMLVGDNGIYHLESKNKFDINSLSLLKEEDVTITYHVSLKKQSYEEIKSSELPKPYYSEYKEPPEQLWRVYPSGYGTITVPDDCSGIDIEADQYCVFNINQQQIIMGATERFVYSGKITDLSFEGHFDIENQRVITQKNDNSYFIDDISITFFRDGGESVKELDLTGVVGYFDYTSIDIHNKIWVNKINNNNNITLNGGGVSAASESYMAIGDNLGDFTDGNIPKIIYIVLKTQPSELENCIVSAAKQDKLNDGGFGIWQTNVFTKPENVIDTPYILGEQEDTDLFHCLTIARTSNVNTDGKNGVMFFIDGVLSGFIDDNSYNNYNGFISFLRFFNGEEYINKCDISSYIRAILIGNEEHSVKQIIRNNSYLQKHYI